ncbi:MAG: 4-hydroxy-tetrahydrodipicolinate synthase [Solirubrobacterales bacterium]
MTTDSGQISGILTAMVTPFGPGGEVNEGSLRRLARHLIEHGSDGLVVAGTTGEASTLADSEHLHTIEVVVDEVGGETTVIAGTGSNDTAHAIHLTERASALGVDGVLVVTPYYNKPSRLGLVEHFTAVAAATTKPVVLYNIPGRCVLNLDPDLLAELGEIANVVGVKQANADIEQARRIVEDTNLALIAGDDSLLRPFAEIGGAGGITVTSHLFGEQMHELFEAARDGDLERAREIDEQLADAFETLFMTASPTLTKAALNLLGFDVGGLRLPLVEATDDERDTVRAMLERHGLAVQTA